MMNFRSHLAVLWCLLSLAPAIGCTSQKQAPPADNDAAREASNDSDSSADQTKTEAPTANAEPAGPTAPFVLGDMLDRFDPPPLEEIDKTAAWENRPVLDGMVLMRKHQAEMGPPPITVEEALSLRNDSRETNAKIANTLGRLAPKTAPASTKTRRSSCWPKATSKAPTRCSPAASLRPITMA